MEDFNSGTFGALSCTLPHLLDLNILKSKNKRLICISAEMLMDTIKLFILYLYLWRPGPGEDEIFERSHKVHSLNDLLFVD